MTDIVFVHGWPLHAATWRRVVERLPQHRCHLPNLPGAPGSTWDERSDFTIGGLAAWLRGWIDAQGLTRYALVGFDSGGQIARLCADGDPRVSALILSNTEV